MRTRILSTIVAAFASTALAQTTPEVKSVVMSPSGAEIRHVGQDAGGMFTLAFDHARSGGPEIVTGTLRVSTTNVLAPAIRISNDEVPPATDTYTFATGQLNVDVTIGYHHPGVAWVPVYEMELSRVSATTANVAWTPVYQVVNTTRNTWPRGATLTVARPGRANGPSRILVTELKPRQQMPVRGRTTRRVNVPVDHAVTVDDLSAATAAADGSVTVSPRRRITLPADLAPLFPEVGGVSIFETVAGQRRFVGRIAEDSFPLTAPGSRFVEGVDPQIRVVRKKQDDLKRKPVPFDGGATAFQQIHGKVQVAHRQFRSTTYEITSRDGVARNFELSHALDSEFEIVGVEKVTAPAGVTVSVTAPARGKTNFQVEVGHGGAGKAVTVCLLERSKVTTKSYVTVSEFSTHDQVEERVALLEELGKKTTTCGIDETYANFADNQRKLHDFAKRAENDIVNAPEWAEIETATDRIFSLAFTELDDDCKACRDDVDACEKCNAYAERAELRGRIAHLIHEFNDSVRNEIP